ncbi:MFS general substrate transporter [Pleurotus eryngii]|uniref:MFS general substrate transporter n=1 Tax=Pleurotus eryngii TaxID=5323 RepID=A0A9P6A3E2_PLEER|nr:MFS general substrate transporter [Pleurotus eryngii]
MPPYAPNEDNEKAPIQDAESTTSADEIDPVAEKLLRRKLDWILLPLFTVVYCTNFVDRTAIGNARIAGLEKDLGMKGFDYNISLTIFYIFYIAAEIPSNLALKRLGSMWLAAMITSFGIVSIGTAFVKSYTGLIITRIFLGIAEGGTLPGLTYIMSRYYRRSELVLRVGIFFGISPPLAGAFGGLLASGLLSAEDFGMVTSWRKVFFIEGVITTGFGLLCFLIIPTDPQRTRIFTPAERALALARIDADQVVRTNGRKESTTLRLVWRSFNINTMICTVAYVMINISFQGLSLFMPTVVATLGHFTVVESQLRTVPPYLVGAVWAVFVTYVSFRVRKRGIPIIFSCLLVVLGYALAVGTKNSHARYAACFLSIAGASPTGPLLITWGTDNAAPDTIRAVTTAIIPGVGALGSIVAVWTYLPQDAPNYHNGNSLNLATSLFVCLLALIGIIYIRRENAKRARGERNYRLEGKTQEQLENLGYLHPRFRYQI